MNKHTENLVVAGGCFWGVEHLLRQLPGVISTEVGYCGGKTEHPTYEQVCTQSSGHLEAVNVIFDANKITLENVLKYFFEIHDPEQVNGQGPDLGPQYLSAIFYQDETQKKVAENVIEQLTQKGFNVATALKPAGPFWKAEDYHQQYYAKNHKAPYCHFYVKRF